MVTLLSKFKFLCLHIVCAVADAVPRTLWLVHGKSRGVFKVFATPRMRELFALDAVDGLAYQDPPYNGHFGTVLCAFRPNQPVPYKREISPGGDGNPMCVDWHLCGGESKALFVIFPGLASWSGTNYIQRFVNYAHRQSYDCAVFNTRGLGDTPLEKPRAMSADWTEDIRAVVYGGSLSRAAIARRCGRESIPVIGVGFSLGGVILSKFTGEECRDGRPPFDAAFVVNAPLDALATRHQMMTPFCRAVYQPSMTGAVVKQARIHMEVFKKLPGLDAETLTKFATGEGEKVLKQIRTIDDFNRIIVCRAKGFSSPLEYYAAISPLRWLKEVTIPTLCVCTEDDPVCGPPPVEELSMIMKARDNISLVVVPHGGHLGYVRGPIAEWRQSPTVMDSFVCQLADRFADARKTQLSVNPLSTTLVESRSFVRVLF